SVNYPCASMRRAFALVLVLLAAGCGGASKPSDPVQSVPDDNAVRAAGHNASTPAKTDFPDAGGKTLEQLAGTLKAGPQLAMASSIFTVGDNRLAFGVIGKDGVPVYGQTALYVAPTPGSPAE